MDANTHIATFLFDAKGQDVGGIDALGNRVTYQYDGNGQQTLKIDPLAQRMTTVYDAVSRRIEERYADGQRHTFAFDSVGNQIRMADSTGITTSVYDAKSRVTAVINPGDRRVTNSYDEIDRRTVMVEPQGGRFSYSFDAANRLTALINPQSKRTTQSFDAVDRLVRQQQGNGSLVTNIYDDAGQTTGIINAKSDGAVISRFTYTFDDAGNRLTKEETGGVRTTWVYDGTSQLVREQRNGANSIAVTHVYDPVGNRTVQIDSGVRTTATYDAGNQLTAENTAGARTTFTHDSCGNRTQKESPSATTFYTWDTCRNLTVVEPPAGKVTMTYNAAGKRVQKETTGDTKKFLYDFERLLQESDGADTVEKTYTSTQEQYGDLLSQYDGTDTSYHQYDALGSTDALLSEAEMATDRYVYRAFGLETHTTGASDNALTFVGKDNYYRDSETDLYFLNARYYDPDAGRFISEDPIGYEAGDVNLFRYVGNNPVNAVDPSGLQAFEFPRFDPFQAAQNLNPLAVAQRSYQAGQRFGRGVSGALGVRGLSLPRVSRPSWLPDPNEVIGNVLGGAQQCGQILVQAVPYPSEVVTCARVLGRNVVSFGQRVLSGRIRNPADLVDLILDQPIAANPLPSQQIRSLQRLLRHPCMQIFPPYRLIRTRVLAAVDRFGPDIGLFLDRVFDILARPDHYVRQLANSPIIRRYLVEMPQAAWQGFQRAVTQFVQQHLPQQLLVHTAGIMQALVDMVSSACQGIISGNILGILTEWIWGLINPIPGLGRDIAALWSGHGGAMQKALAGDFRGTVQKLLDMWDAVNRAFGRFSGWIFILSVVIGAAVGAIAGGVGAIPGAYAGAQVAGYIGLANGVLSVAGALGRLVSDIESLFNAQAPEPQIPEYSAEEDCAFQSYARLSDRMRLRLVDLADQASPAAGAALRGLQVSCNAIASNPQEQVEEPDRLPCQQDDNNREITLRERYQRIAGNLVVVAFTVVLIFAGAAAATLGRRIVQWVLRTTQGVRQAMFRFMQRVFVPLRRLASPALRRRIFGRNWSGWLRRRFGLGTRDLLGRRRTRIGNENHELGLVRHLDGNVSLTICSDRCHRLIGLLEEIKPFQRARRQRAIQRLTDDIREMQQAARNGQNISERFNSVRRRINRLVDDEGVRDDLLDALYGRFGRIRPGGRAARWRRHRWGDASNPPCFPSGTLVHTPDRIRKIDEIQKGDWVLSMNIVSGQLERRRVVECAQNWTQHLVRITLPDEIIFATRDHPFWLPCNREWTPANKLRPGVFVLSRNKKRVPINGVSIVGTQEPTFNFEVEGLHNYLVGTNGVVVHNSAFETTTKTAMEIYVVVNGNQVVYVGQTIQGIDVRFNQHIGAGHPHWRQGYEVRLVGQGNWTPYEAAVWEQHFIDRNGGVAALENRQLAITRENYYQFKHVHNPC